MAELFPLTLTDSQKLNLLIEAIDKVRSLQIRYYKAPKGDVKNNLLLQSKEAEKKLDAFLSQIR